MTPLMESLTHYMLVAFGCGVVAAMVYILMEKLDPSPGFYDYGFPYKKIQRFAYAVIISAMFVTGILFVVLVLVEALALVY